MPEGAYLDVHGEFLGEAAIMLPRSVRIVGSELRGEGVVRLVLSGVAGPLKPGCYTCVVEDNGLTHTVSLSLAGT